MIFYRVVVILIVVFFTVYADENSTDIDIKTHECNENSNGAACYELGQFYSKCHEENSINKTFYYYEQGCKNKHDESCIQEIEFILKADKIAYDYYKNECDKNEDEKCLTNLFFKKHMKLVSIYKMQRNDKLLASKHETIAFAYLRSDAKNKLVSVGFNNFEKEILREKLTNDYISKIRIVLLQCMSDLQRQIGQKEGTIFIGFRIIHDGHLENIRIVESSKDESIDRMVLETFQSSLHFESFPKELDRDYLDMSVPIFFGKIL